MKCWQRKIVRIRIKGFEDGRIESYNLSILKILIQTDVAIVWREDG
jgi:hypothetical protein